MRKSNTFQTSLCQRTNLNKIRKSNTSLCQRTYLNKIRKSNTGHTSLCQRTYLNKIRKSNTSLCQRTYLNKMRKSNAPLCQRTYLNKISKSYTVDNWLNATKIFFFTLWISRTDSKEYNIAKTRTETILCYIHILFLAKVYPTASVRKGKC